MDAVQSGLTNNIIKVVFITQIAKTDKNLISVLFRFIMKDMEYRNGVQILKPSSYYTYH